MSEELLRLALQEACEKEFAEFETGEEHVFSLRHRRKMDKLFKKYCSPPKTDTIIKMPVRKRIIIAICVIILATILCVGVVAIATNGFKFDKKEDHTETLTINWENSPKAIDDVYYLTAIPEKYELIESNINTATAEFIYKSDNGDFLVMRQMAKKGYYAYYNTEGYKLEETRVGDLNGFFIDYENELLLVWDNEDYIIQISGNFTKEEMIDLAKSAEIKK